MYMYISTSRYTIMCSQQNAMYTELLKKLYHFLVRLYSKIMNIDMNNIDDR